jgi:HK97 family phage major capsid protein
MPDHNHARNESLDAMSRLLAIRSAAGDRPLTQAQQRDQAEQVRRLDAAIDVLGGESRYLDALRNGMREAEDPTYYAREINRIVELDAAPDALRSMATTRTEGPRSSEKATASFMDAWTSRALTGIAADGSNVVSTDFSNLFWETLRARGTLLGTNLTEFRTNDYQFQIPIGTAATTVSITGQGTAIAESTPGGTAALIIPQRFGALSQVTQEFWDDISPQQREYILQDHIKSIRNSMEFEMIQGNGGPGFTGLTDSVAHGTVSAGTVAHVGLAPYASAVGSAYAASITPSHFLVSALDYGKLAAVTAGGTVGGDLRPLITPAANAAGGALSQEILGIPALVSSNVPSGTAFLIDDSQLLFVRRTDVSQMIDPYSLSNTYSLRLRTVARAGFHAIPNRFIRINGLL